MSVVKRSYSFSAIQLFAHNLHRCMCGLRLKLTFHQMYKAMQRRIVFYKSQSLWNNLVSELKSENNLSLNKITRSL